MRAVFAGIGRLLLIADRPEASSAWPPEGPASSAEQRRTESARSAGSGAGTASPPAYRWRSLDQTGNVRLLSADELDDEFDDDLDEEAEERQFEEALLEEAQLEEAQPEEAQPEEAQPEEAQPEEAQPEKAQLEEAQLSLGAPVVLPLTNYDELSLPSIRARLSRLDTSQLRILADYERRNAERPEILGMLERRIDKLEAGG